MNAKLQHKKLERILLLALVVKRTVIMISYIGGLLLLAKEHVQCVGAVGQILSNIK